MTNIPDTEYITVKRDVKGQGGIFVGGKPTTTYRGKGIYNTDLVKRVFVWMQEHNPNIAEFHIGAFVALGEDAKLGNPDGAFGSKAWCRVKYKNGILGAWVSPNAYGSSADCARDCAYYCAFYVRADSAFRAAVFGATIEKQNVNPMAKSKNPELKKLEQVDFSKLPKSPIELNGYRILVEKISTRTK